MHTLPHTHTPTNTHTDIERSMLSKLDFAANNKGCCWRKKKKTEQLRIATKRAGLGACQLS